MPEASPARPSRRMPHPRATAAVLSCALLLGTAACASPDGDAPRASTTAPSAAATDEPIYASDEEALAAAVEAYEAYSEMSNRIANAGGEGSESIATLVTEDVNEALQAEFAAIREGELRTVGTTIVYGGLLEAWETSEAEIEASALFCRDVSGTRVVRKDGSDATAPDRDVIQAVRVTFVSGPGNPNDLLISGVERWQDESHC